MKHLQHETDSGDSTSAGNAKATTSVKNGWVDEALGIFWLLLAVIGFHSLIAKPFYIPSESMMPGLLVGDRLVVSKYPYGWSFVSPTFHLLPFMHGRLLGQLPKRGDVVIIAPPGKREDWIKRVIGLPGDRIEMRNGTVILNGVPVKRAQPELRRLPVDENAPCSELKFRGLLVSGTDGKQYCELAVVRETLPNGRSYDTIEMGTTLLDDFPALSVPDGHLFVMGDNRDGSLDSRAPLAIGGLGGPIPWENVGGRAEFITFSLDRNVAWWNPFSWFQALRPNRAGSSLHPDEAER